MSLIRTAKKTGIPYTVNELSNSEFLDFKQLCPQVGKNFHKTTEGLDLKMTEFRVLKVEKDKPDSFMVKTSFREEEPFHTIKLFPTRKKSKSAEQTSTAGKSIIEYPKDIPQLYGSKLQIADRKKEDVLELLKSKIIPAAYRDYYNSLFCQNT